MSSRQAKRARKQAALEREREAELTPVAPRAAAPFALTEKRERWLLAGVLFVTAVVYLRSLGGEFVYDDAFMIVRNPEIGRWNFLSRSLVHDSWWFQYYSDVDFRQSSYYRPFQDVWLGLNYHLFGLNPHLWHIPMIGLHLIAVWLVYKVARTLLRSAPGALITALLYGLIPIHADAVVWASAVPLPLSAIFELAAFYLFATRASALARNWSLSLLLFVAALLSHESAMAFPGLIAAYSLLLEGAENRSAPEMRASAARIVTAERLQRAIVEALPFATVTAAYFVVRLLVLGFIADNPGQENYATLAQAATTAPWAWIHFVEITLLPWLAGPTHRVRYVGSWASPEFVLPLVILAALAGLLIFGRMEKRRFYLFCALWFFIPLIPELALIRTHPDAFVQDRYLYLPSFAWCLFLGDAVISVAAAYEAARRPMLIALAAVAAVYATTLFQAERFWHDNLSYFAECAARYPEVAPYHHDLGAALVKAGRLHEALGQMNTAINLYPAPPFLWDRGLLNAMLGRYPDAVRDKVASARLKPRRVASDYAALAEDADKAGEPSEVEAALKAAEALPDGRRQAAMVRAELAFRHGDSAGAIRILKDLVKDYPSDPHAWYLLANAQFVAKNYADAASGYLRAIALSRNDFPEAHYRAALALHRLGRDDEALAQCVLTLHGSPEDQKTRALITEIESHRKPGG